MERKDFMRTCLTAVGMISISNSAWSLLYSPTTVKEDWAILFGTWCGSSRDASIWISEGMDGIANVFDVRENPDLSKYKYIIIGGSIREGKTPNELQVYLNKHKESLKGKIKGLFAVCGNMQQPITSQQYSQLIDNHLAKLTDADNFASKVFLGRITFGLMEPKVRDQMKAFPGIEEYDNLKRSECMDFGREILKKFYSQS